MESTRLIFKDSVQNRQFEEIGFSILPGLQDSQLKELETVFRIIDIEQSSQKGWYNTAHKKQLEENLKVSNSIRQLVEPSVLPYLENYRSVVGAFLVKRGSVDSVVTPHADWAMMDEQRGRGASAFLSLYDVDVSTGCLYIVPASHKLVELNRGYAPGQRTGWADIEDCVVRYAIPVPLKRGEILLIDHRMVHFSPAPNLNHVERILVSCGFLPAEIPCRHFSECYRDEWGSVFREFEVEDAFYLDPKRTLHPVGFYPVSGYRRQPKAESNLDEAPDILARAHEIARKVYAHLS